MVLEKKKTIIVTLLLDEVSQSFFDTQRKEYFPAFANFTNAHLTLFHCLPNRDLVIETLSSKAKKTTTFSIDITSIVNKKSFNGYGISSKTLSALHTDLQNEFTDMLSKKDLKPIWPHITIQNKTTAYKAEKTFTLLQESFSPFTAHALGMSCWYYTKNCWEKKEDFLFR